MRKDSIVRKQMLLYMTTIGVLILLLCGTLAVIYTNHYMGEKKEELTSQGEKIAAAYSAQRKTWGEESCIIVMNVNTEAAQVDLSGYADWTLTASVSANGEAITMEGTTLNLPAFGLAVLLPDA